MRGADLRHANMVAASLFRGVSGMQTLLGAGVFFGLMFVYHDRRYTLWNFAGVLLVMFCSYYLGTL